MNVEHLRQRIDQFERRAEEPLEADERHRLHMACIGIERALEAVAERLQRDVAGVQELRQRVQRLRARM